QIEMTNQLKRLESLGNTVGSVVEASLVNYMITRDMNVLNDTLYNLVRVKSLTGISLINKRGVIKATTDVCMLETEITPSIQWNKGEKARGNFLDGRESYRWVQTVKNGPRCYKCHDPSIKYNGAIIMDFSFREFQRELEKSLLEGIVIILLTVAVIVLTMLALSKKIVTKRLNTVIAKARSIKEGAYDTVMPVEGNDEITKLEDNFNEMAAAINDRDKEKDILFERVSSSQKMWEETFDSIGDLISIHDRELNIIKVNRAFYAYFGLDPKEPINKKCYDFFHAGDAPPAVCPGLITLNENRPATVEIHDVKTNKIFQISTFPFYYHDARFQGLIHIARDITEEKEKELRLIMSDRLAALGQMASGIAHEINNPLASIAGCAEGLLARIKTERFDPVLFEKYLNIIEEEISRCKKITIDMLSFVREKAYEKKEVNLNESLDKTLEIIGFQGRLKGIKVIKNYADALPVIHASEGELRQAFIAIITNALDAMQDNGELTLETGVIPPSPPLAKGGEGGFVFIKISDTGAGIPPEHIDRIFTPFFSTKTQKGGTGLGLSIARKIITDNNGNIHVSSTIAKGAAFKITLPIINT
ncbi:MAG: HAMP domain-containing protein, partial [Nitrospirae bacterium]